MILFFKSCFYIQISKDWLCPCIQIFRKGRKKTKINDCLMKAGMSIDGSLKKMQNWIQVLGEGGNVSLHWNDCFSLWNMKQRVIIVMCLTLSHHHEKWEDDIKSVSYYYQLDSIAVSLFTNSETAATTLWERLQNFQRALNQWRYVWTGCFLID